MKILLSAYACMPGQGTELGNGWNWASHLAQNGHDVVVFTSANWKDAIEENIKFQQISNPRFVYIALPAVLEPLIKARRGIKLQIHYLLWQWYVYYTAKKLDLIENFDIVHHVTLGSLQGGTWLWRLGKPLVFGPVGGGQTAPPAFKKFFMEFWWRESIRTFITHHLLRFTPTAFLTMKKADVVLATNKETVELAKKLGAKRVVFILDNSVSESYLLDQPPSLKKTNTLKLLWVGSLLPRKALNLALEALSRVDREIPFVLTIVGGGVLQNRLNVQIEKLGLVDKVVTMGNIPWDEVRNAYLQSDIFIFTSLRDSCPAQLMEAMAVGLPIITLNHHGSRDIVPNNAGIKVNVDTPDECVKNIAQAIEFLYHDPSLRFEMGNAGWNFARTATWSNKINTISEIYTTL